MSKKETNKIFDNKNIRVVFDDEQREWYFSVVDVVAALTDSKDAAAYWRKFKQRMKSEGHETVTNCHALKLRATDGKMRSTDMGTIKQIRDIAQFVPSSKTVSFDHWLEQIEDQVSSNSYQLQSAGEEAVIGEIVLYQPDDSVNIEVRLEDETVWLTQDQIVDLFQSSKGNISEHIANIYEQGELEEGATVRDFRTVQTEGGRKVTRTLTYYNLDVIISVGRHHSQRCENRKKRVICLDDSQKMFTFAG